MIIYPAQIDDKQLEIVQRWMASLEMKYADIDRKRLREFVTIGITQETADAYIAVVKDMEIAYKRHTWILEARKKERERYPQKRTPAW